MTIEKTAIGDTPPHTEPHTEPGLPIRHRPASTIVKLTGDLDIATAPAMRERLAAALLHPGMELLILDLSEVSRCDTAGLAVLIGTQRRATALGTALCLAAPRPQVTKILRVTGLDRALTIRPTPAAALANPTPQHPTSPQPPSGEYVDTGPSR